MKVSVPVILKNIGRSDRNALLKRLRDLDCGRVMLALGTYELDPEKREEVFRKLTEEAAFFHGEGFEVGAWLWTFLTPGVRKFGHMVLTDGCDDPNMNCPSDEDFVRFAGEYVREIAKSGVDVILYDDDFRMGWLGEKSCGCFCSRHLAAAQKILKKPIPADFEKRVLGGSANEYRSAWMKAKGDSLKSFAAAMRKAVDSVSPKTRLGLCACMSTWDLDGVSAYELSKLLAGQTKPFLRLIGAPYWVGHFGGTRLQEAIEYERMERSWCGDDAEILAEGDTYPRPRFVCPASHLESFDMALRIDGRTNGILKYAIDYTASAEYETGYAERHVLHRDAYRAIDELFSGKKSSGVRVYEPLRQFEDAEIPEKLAGKKSQELFFRTSCKLFAALGLPTSYEPGDGAIAVFGESARHLPIEDAKRGLILDAKAAVILKERGVDTGIISLGGEFAPSEEYYPAENEYVGIAGGSAVWMAISDKAVVESQYTGEKPATVAYGYEYMGDKPSCASYRYENADGARFYVLGFFAEGAKEKLWRQYLKGKKIAEAVEYLTGSPLPACVHGAPDVYVMAKEDEGDGTLGVAILNLSADDILKPVVTLGKNYRSLYVYGNEGELGEKCVKLGRIEPFGFCFLELGPEISD